MITTATRRAIACSATSAGELPYEPTHSLIDFLSGTANIMTIYSATMYAVGYLRGFIPLAIRPLFT